MFWSCRGEDSHQWRTLQMFLELSEASCWNVFPLHEETRAATLLAAPTGSRDQGHVTEENLTSGFGSWPSPLRSSQPGLPTRIQTTDLRPKGERRRPSATSNAWSLPHTRGYTDCRAGDTVRWTDWGHSHRWTHTRPRACLSACTLCTAAQLTKKNFA